MMTNEEIWGEIEKLTIVEKLQLIEDIARSIREDLEKDEEIDKAKPNVSQGI
ncbi:MAG: hypothetical protein ACR2MG_16495 [Pyrinomonadaceae bacterium]